MGTFTIIRELSRRELERHQKRFLGITASVPVFDDLNKTQDPQTGDWIQGQDADGNDLPQRLEWVVDVRVGRNERWGLVKRCIVASWAVGAITDMNIPVLCERGESGRVSVIARSEMRLPDISLDTYSLADLGLIHLSGLVRGEDLVWRDGFGYPCTSPYDRQGSSEKWTWSQELKEFGSSAFDFEDGPLAQVEAGWEITDEEPLE